MCAGFTAAYLFSHRSLNVPIVSMGGFFGRPLPHEANATERERESEIAITQTQCACFVALCGGYTGITQIHAHTLKHALNTRDLTREIVVIGGARDSSSHTLSSQHTFGEYRCRMNSLLFTHTHHNYTSMIKHRDFHSTTTPAHCKHMPAIATARRGREGELAARRRASYAIALKGRMRSCVLRVGCSRVHDRLVCMSDLFSAPIRSAWGTLRWWTMGRWGVYTRDASTECVM